MNGEAVGLASGSDWKQRRQPDGMLLVQGLQLLTLGTTPCPPRLLPPSTTLQRVHRRSVSVNRTNNVLWLQRPSSVYSRLSRLSLLNNQRRDEIHWPLLVSSNSGGYGGLNDVNFESLCGPTWYLSRKWTFDQKL